MKLPKELKGEVKKFELEALLVIQAFSTEFLKGGEYLEPIHHELMQLNDIGHFYTQPFKPEMIEKYFEGWRYLDDYFHKHLSLSQTIIFSGEFSQFTKRGSFLYLSNIPIKNLSHFIDTARLL